jgi:inosose dehydratase
VDIAGIVAALEGAGYQGWYVLEQDTVLAGPADDPVVDVRASLAFLRDLPGGGGR